MSEIQNTDYFVTYIEDGHRVMQLVVLNAPSSKDAEATALEKFPDNSLTGNKWTDMEVVPTEQIDAMTLARAYRLTHGAQR